jgi:hypothetical protein
MIKLFFNIFILVFVFSCAQPAKENPQMRSHIIGVDNEIEEDEKKPALHIESTGVSIGPTIGNDLIISGDSSQSAVMAISMGPGLMRSFAAIDLLKEMERKKIQPHIVHAVDMATVIVSLYAFGKSLDMIEWLFFNFLHESKDDPVFSERWFQKAEEILLKDIGDKKPSESDITLMLPVFDRIDSKIIYSRELTIKEIFRAQFRYGGSIKNELQHTSPTPHGVFYAKELRRKGADIIIGFDFIGDNITFKKPNSFMHGIYGRSSTTLNREKESLDLLIELSFLKQALDKINIQNFREQYTALEVSDKIKPVVELYNDWQPKRKQEADLNESFDHILDLRENSELMKEDKLDE